MALTGIEGPSNMQKKKRGGKGRYQSGTNRKKTGKK